MDTILSYLFLVFVILCVLIIYAGLRKAVGDTADKGLKRIPGIFIVLVFAWMAIISSVAMTGFLLDFTTVPPRLIMVLPVPLITILYFTFTPGTMKLLDLIPHRWMVNMQSFRVIVELFLWWMFIDNMLPVQMTFEGLNFDIVAGLTAPFAAYFLLKDGALRRTAAIAWNIFGLLLLGNIISIALMSTPSVFRVFENEPANIIVATFPYILLPGILVPIAYSMHFFSLRKLLSER